MKKEYLENFYENSNYAENWTSDEKAAFLKSLEEIEAALDRLAEGKKGDVKTSTPPQNACIDNGTSNKNNVTISQRDKNVNKSNETFKGLLEKYYSESFDTSTDSYCQALQDVGRACAFSVLKKCIDPQNNGNTHKKSYAGGVYNSSLRHIRRDLIKACHDLDNMALCQDKARGMVIDSKGACRSKILDKYSDQSIEKLSMETLGVGYDLVQQAIVTILEEEATHRGRLDSPYIKKELNKKVWIKLEDSVNGWAEKETTPIQEVYKEVRRYIESERSLKIDVKDGHSYISGISKNPWDPEKAETIYKKLGKYADMGGYCRDYNGSYTVYTVDNTTVDEMDDLITRLNLTSSEEKILDLVLRGYGNKSIATYLGISENAVKGRRERIKIKALKIGLAPKDC